MVKQYKLQIINYKYNPNIFINLLPSNNIEKLD